MQLAFPDRAMPSSPVPDPKKGEQLVLFTTDAGPRSQGRSRRRLEGAGVIELMIPRNIVHCRRRCRYSASGKADYVTLNRLAREKVRAVQCSPDRLAMAASTRVATDISPANAPCCRQRRPGHAARHAACSRRPPRSWAPTELMPITFAHLDACFYAGEAHVDFAQFMLDHGATFAVPTWTNSNGVSSLPIRTCGLEASDAGNRQRCAQTDARSMKRSAAKPVWTCAPYQLPGGPQIRRSYRRG